MTARVSLDALIAITDGPLTPAGANLLVEVDAWCERTCTGSSAFGQMALDHGGLLTPDEPFDGALEHAFREIELRASRNRSAGASTRAARYRQSIGVPS